MGKGSEINIFTHNFLNPLHAAAVITSVGILIQYNTENYKVLQISVLIRKYDFKTVQ